MRCSAVSGEPHLGEQPPAAGIAAVQPARSSLHPRLGRSSSGKSSAEQLPSFAVSVQPGQQQSELSPAWQVEQQRLSALRAPVSLRLQALSQLAWCR